MKVLVTGASGFVGRALVAHLQAQPRYNLKTAVRRTSKPLPQHVNTAQIVVGDLGAETDWRPALVDVDVVVHLAARVHVLHEQAEDPLLAFRQVNVTGSIRLARMAAEAGVKRMIYMSSAKVHGEATLTGQPFNENCSPSPEGAYAISKLETERGLEQVARATGLELTTIRPPLVYGAGVGANFAALATAVARGKPLPLGSIHNQRSLVSIDNLVDLIAQCLSHEAAANQTFLASDGEDLSTTGLIERIAHAMHKQAHLLPVPAWMLVAAARILGKQGVAQRLCGNLQLDSGKARQLLNWKPPVSVDEGLRRAVVSYQN